MAQCAVCDEVVVTHHYVRATFGETRQETLANGVFIDLKHTMAAATRVLPKERPLIIRWNPRKGVRRMTLERMAGRVGLLTDLELPEHAILERLFVEDPAMGSLTMRALEGLATTGMFVLTIEGGTKPSDVLDVIPWESEKPEHRTPESALESSRILAARTVVANAEAAPSLDAEADAEEEN